MKSSTILVSALSLISCVAAHGTVDLFTGGGKGYVGPFSIEVDHPSIGPSPVRQLQRLEPVTDVTGSDIICGNGAVSSAEEIAPVAAGSPINFHWRSGIGSQWPHKWGPIMTYMAQCPSTADKCDASKLKWFKTDQQGVRTDLTPAGTWAQSLISDGYGFNTTIPAGIPNGDYLIRQEIVALHNAMTKGLAEFYVSCTQVRVSGGGSKTPAANDLVSFPGAYSPTDPGILVDIWTNFNGLAYNFPGPNVFDKSGGAASANAGTAPESSAPTPAKTSSSRVVASSTGAAPASTTTAKGAKKCTAAKKSAAKHKRSHSRVMRRIAQQDLAGFSYSS